MSLLSAQIEGRIQSKGNPVKGEYKNKEMIHDQEPLVILHVIYSFNS